MDPDDMKKIVAKTHGWAEFLKTSGLEKAENWATEYMNNPEPYVTGYDYGREEAKSVVYSAVETGSMIEKTAYDERKRKAAERKERARKDKEAREREIEVVCADNTGYEEFFDKDERYMAKEARIDVGSGPSLYVFDPYGRWRLVPKAMFHATNAD